MSNLLKLSYALAALILGANAFGQQCPESIEVAETLRLPLEGWRSSIASSKYFLIGMDIIEGEIHPSNDENAILAPIDEGDEVSIWKFSQPLSSDEVWMRCNYHGTEVHLVRRIDAGVTKCFLRLGIGTAARQKERSKAQAECSR